MARVAEVERQASRRIIERADAEGVGLKPDHKGASA
jgi:hypothetical protein